MRRYSGQKEVSGASISVLRWEGSAVPYRSVQGLFGRQGKVDRCARKEQSRALMGWIERRAVH
jgi:hypothetical protein